MGKNARELKDLLSQLSSLKKGNVKKIIDSRLIEFKELGKSSEDDIFSELCFCLLTANYSAEGGMRRQNVLGNNFGTLSL